MNNMPAKAAVVAAVAAALAIPASQAVFGWGLTASQFSDQGDETLRAAGWAFSIWGLIYTGLAAFALYQLWDRGGVLQGVRWPAAAAALGCGLWILAAGFDSRWLTVVIIATAAMAAVAAAARARGAGERPLVFRVLALWPLSLLAGWLTIASLVNLLTVLTAEGLIAAEARLPAALAGIGAAALIAIMVAVRARLLVYALPVVWGLAAVAWAAWTDGRPAAAAAALTAAVLLAAGAAWRLRMDSATREP